ncbi:related to tol protein [Fusarium torulosum]|uniref:Related to tol protein n=1 Tax=Fusarium torulosum TaxID=33205 RepID=A0AAE8MH64_9HYPO|nr:related to tol protein [Fusarium torulosum]
MPQTTYPLPGQHERVSQRVEDRDNAFHQRMLREIREVDMPIMFQLHDNSFDGSRGWGEPLVYAPTSPHRVRPSGQMLLEYDWERSGDGDPQFRILKEVDDEKYAHNNIQLRTNHQLCIACKDTLNRFCTFRGPRDDSERIYNNVLHSENLSSLFMSAGLQRCFICRQILAKVKKMYPNLDEEAYSNYMIECCWSVSDAKDETKMWMVMYDRTMEKRPLYNYQHILRLGLWNKKYFGSYFGMRSNQAEAEAEDGGAKGDTNDHVGARDMALSWLSRCIQNADGQHDICNQSDRDYLPTRLLDVRHALEQGNVRLVIPDEKPETFTQGDEYASLSHCWGANGAQENPMLLVANLESRQSDGLDWDKLPKTFQDAFKIASWLKLDWLWIDSLCIIQDSISDWQNEASMMDRVYMNAKVNISADKGGDSRAGCFAQRKETDITPLEFGVCRNEEEFMMTTEDIFSWMDSAPSLSRAWIHRERQLSRRILHFTPKEMVWECCGLNKACFASETLPGGAPFKKVFNGETKFQVELADISNNKLSEQDRLDKLHKLWNTTCQDLSNKSITYASDFPMILSSLAKEFHRLMPDDEYVAGHWRSTLVEALTWWVPGDKLEYSGYIAPSWSWLSIAEPVQLYHPNHKQHKRALIEVLDTEIQFNSPADKPYGQLSSGSALRVRGFLRRFHFHFTGHENDGIILSVIEEDEHGQDRLRLISEDWDAEDGLAFRMTTDSALVLSFQEYECYGLLTTIDEWAQYRSGCRRQLECLLLEKVPGNGQEEDRYRRVGTLSQFNDMVSFKLRYQVAPDSTVPEAGVSRNIWVENPKGYTGRPVHGASYVAPVEQDQEAPTETATEPRDGDIATHDAETSSNKGEDETIELEGDEDLNDIWWLLKEYLCWVRWMIIRDAKEKREEEKEKEKEKENATKASDFEESDMQDSEREDGEEEEEEEDGDDSQTKSEISTGNANRDRGITASIDVNEADTRTGTPSAEMKENHESSTEASDTAEKPEQPLPISSGTSEDRVSAEENEGNEDSDEADEGDEADGDDEGDEDEEDDETEEDDKDSKSDVKKDKAAKKLEVVKEEYGILSNIILRLHEHSSSALDSILKADDREKAWKEVTRKYLFLKSKTVAWGTDQVPDIEAALYQFDDVLDKWRDLNDLVPWLRRLEASEVLLI